MHPQAVRPLLGFVKLDLGGIEVQVPILSAEDEASSDAPRVSLECHGPKCEIVVRGDATSPAVGEAMPGVAAQALRHLSHTMLN
jgi:hypothetical protein